MSVNGTRLIDYAPAVIEALKNGPLNQTALSEAVWGTSGRGNPSLTKALFPHMAERGSIRAEKRGRSIVYSLP